MNIEYHTGPSTYLKRDMEYKVYGSSGVPLLLFPTACARFYQYEDMGLIEACREFIDSGKVMIVTADSIDAETWFEGAKTPDERVRHHEDYEKYILKELLPLIAERNTSGVLPVVAGCSMGAFHAMNFMLRHPDLFSGCISLSGVYASAFFFKEYTSPLIKEHMPVDRLKALKSKKAASVYAGKRIIACCGQGSWEHPILEDTIMLRDLFAEKKIEAWVDIWGEDVYHDWPWWERQFPYFIEHVLS